MHPLIRENVSLRPYHTFHLDATARYMARFSSVDELRTLLEDPLVKSSKQLILGGGSNILFRSDFDGIVLRNEIRGIRLIGETENDYIVRAAAGESWHSFVLHSIEHNRAGIENLSLIPGNVGAGPIQNIGAYGVELKDVVESVEAFHRNDLVTHHFSNSDCQFGYRESIFKRRDKDQWVILSVTFRLHKRPVFHIGYGAIQEELDKMKPDRLTIKHVSDAIIRIRQSKLPDPSEAGNAGSFFKNPVVSLSRFQELKQRYPDIPSYPVDENSVKVPAGWLIEKGGWKGFRRDNYGVHVNQALVLVNYGGARGEEILQLSEDILTDIRNKFGIDMEREVNIAG